MMIFFPPRTSWTDIFFARSSGHIFVTLCELEHHINSPCLIGQSSKKRSCSIDNSDNSVELPGGRTGWLNLLWYQSHNKRAGVVSRRCPWHLFRDFPMPMRKTSGAWCGFCLWKILAYLSGKSWHIYIYIYRYIIILYIYNIIYIYIYHSFGRAQRVSLNDCLASRELSSCGPASSRMFQGRKDRN